jgi:hypothetical protein
MALILGGKVKNIKLNDNASGSCATASNNHLKEIIVFLSGYSFSALTSYGLFFFMKHELSFLALWFLAFLAAIALVLWIKNRFAMLWTFCFIAINLSLLFIAPIWFLQPYIIIFYAILIGVENFFSCITLLTISVKNKKKAGDATLLAKATHISAIIWALAFLAFSLWIMLQTFIGFFPKP